MNPSRLGLILPREMKICLLADPWNSFQFTVLSYQGKKNENEEKNWKRKKRNKNRKACAVLGFILHSIERSMK